ncbi:MAG: corrinoid protein [Anaerolineales bacterium]|jgi:5-methyltetrahydrofolate--homocysteine methyltransferase|nr:corrinoid protein [Chloroflexota bacterium]MBK6646673.1 corrinoid protein [Anaerolineales bacterium]MCC6986829.1 corrinoid protein [Anaerolineales bacterium]
MEEVLQKLFDAVLEGDFDGVKTNVTAALEAGLDPNAILNDGMIAAMREVGVRFEAGEYYVPEMLIAARAMQSGMTLLKPHLQKTEQKSNGRVLMGTVKGDLHDIGKNLVGLMLEGAGYEIIDLGVDVPAEEFVKKAMELKPDIIGMSALLTTTMASMKTTLDALDAAGLRRNIKVIIGGAPVTEAYAQHIEADGFSPDASRAVNLVNELLGKQG